MRLYRTIIVLSTFTIFSPLHGAECPVTVPNLESPEGTLKSSKTRGWGGSSDLAALIPVDGHWNGMGPDRNYADKFWWWADSYSVRDEPVPQLTVTGLRLDGQAPSVIVENTTNGFGKNWSAMLVGMEFPTPGCWEVMGTYRGQQLQLILKVGGS